MTIHKPAVLSVAILLGLVGAGVYWLQYRHTRPVVSQDPNAEYPVVVAGDSLAAGYGASSAETGFAPQLYRRVSEKYPKASLTNLGIVGATAHDVVTSELSDPSMDTAKLVVIVVGTNDILKNTAKETFAKDYEELVTRIARPDRQVLLLNVPRFSQTPIVPEALRRLADFNAKQFNESIMATARTRPGTTVVDFYRFSSDQLQPGSSLISGDGFHPNDEGYRLMADLVAAYVD